MLRHRDAPAAAEPVPLALPVRLEPIAPRAVAILQPLRVFCCYIIAAISSVMNGGDDDWITEGEPRRPSTKALFNAYRRLTRTTMEAPQANRVAALAAQADHAPVHFDAYPAHDAAMGAILQGNGIALPLRFDAVDLLHGADSVWTFIRNAVGQQLPIFQQVAGTLSFVFPDRAFMHRVFTLIGHELYTIRVVLPLRDMYEAFSVVLPEI